MGRKREIMFKIIPTDWKDKFRKDWLRELINKRRIKNGGDRTISTQQLNAVIEEKMREMNTSFEIKAINELIEEVKNGKEI